MAYSPNVERWRELISRYFRPADVDKALHVIQWESGGNPDIYGDGSNAVGLFQHNTGGLASGRSLQALQDPEANIRLAAEAIYGGQGWRPWGEGATYQGKPFGALGSHPYTPQSPPSFAPDNLQLAQVPPGGGMADPREKRPDESVAQWAERIAALDASEGAPTATTTESTTQPRVWTGQPADGRPYGTYILGPDGRPQGDPIGNPQAPQRPGALNRPTGYTIDQITGAGGKDTGLGTALGPPDSGGYVQRYQESQYFPGNYEPTGTPFRPAGAATTKPLAVQEVYQTLANGDRQVYNADLLAQNPGIGLGALMYTTHKKGGITPNPAYKGAAADVKESVSAGAGDTGAPGTTSPSIGSQAGNFSYTTPGIEGVTGSSTTTNEGITGPGTGTSTGVSGGYLSGPAAITGRDNPGSMTGNFLRTGTQEEQDADWRSMQQEAANAGLHTAQVSSKTPDKVTFKGGGSSSGSYWRKPQAEVRSLEKRLAETKIRYGAYLSHSDESRLAKIEDELDAARAVAASRPRPERTDANHLYLNRLRGLKNGGSVVTNRPALVIDEATGRPLAEISENYQPERLTFPHVGRMNVTPMARGGSIEVDDNAGPPRAPVTPPDLLGDYPEIQAARQFAQQQAATDAVAYKRGLAGLGAVRKIPLPIGAMFDTQQWEGQGPPPWAGRGTGGQRWENPEIGKYNLAQIMQTQLPAGVEWDIPDVGSSIINLRNQLAAIPKGGQGAQDTLRQLSIMKTLLGQFYPALAKGVLPSNPEYRRTDSSAPLGSGLT